MSIEPLRRPLVRYELHVVGAAPVPERQLRIGGLNMNGRVRIVDIAAARLITIPRWFIEGSTAMDFPAFRVPHTDRASDRYAL
jgi:hypothetical protein